MPRYKERIQENEINKKLYESTMVSIFIFFVQIAAREREGMVILSAILVALSVIYRLTLLPNFTGTFCCKDFSLASDSDTLAF